MTRTIKHLLAGLLVSPAFAAAQAPVVPAVPKPMTAPPAATLPPVAAPAPITPAPAAPAPAVADPAKGCDGCPKEEAATPKEKFLLEKLLAGCPAAQTLGKNGWTVYGWTQGSYTASTNRVSNLPVPFIDRAREFSLNQNWIHVEKAVDTSKQEYQWGMAADGIIPGTDYRTTVARGLFDQQVARGTLYGFDLYQAYVDIFSPNIGPSGTTFRFGKFATFLEYEVVQGISNPFVSRSYLFQYNPFTHTGGLAITPLNDDWTVQNGVVLGNDNFIDPTARLTYIGQVKWAPKDGKTSVALGTTVTNPRYNAAEAFNYYNVYNLQVTHKFTDKLQYVMDASFSHEDQIPGVGSANWYGFVHYLFYDVTDKLQSKVRLDLFNDTKGVRTGADGLYTAVTYGLTWKPKPWLYVMPEVRYDHNSGTGTPFEGKRDLFTATIGAIVRW
jgi:hypothetical protein